MNEKSNSETVHLKFSFDEAFILFRCMVSISMFTMYIDDAMARNNDFSIIDNLKNKIKDAIKAEPDHVDSKLKNDEVIKYYEAQMRRRKR